jgi:hypothetical protein
MDGATNWTAVSLNPEAKLLKNGKGNVQHAAD